MDPRAKLVKDDLVDRLFESIKTIIAEIPASHEREVNHPELRGRELTKAASLKAATISGTLALPPGPLGIITILPDLVGIWRLQTKLVSDIAALFGMKASLTQETMLYCLFRHAAAQVIRDLVSRVGERIVVQRVSLRLIERRIGIEMTHRIAGRSIVRFLPLIGALGVAGYAYYDTAQVGQTAIDFFSTQDKSPAPILFPTPHESSSLSPRGARRDFSP
jgi:hypothetical protein